MDKLIEKYIIYCINSEVQLNQYVPNSHIGKVFSEVLEWIGYYNSKEHIELFKKYDFEDSVQEVFTNTDLTDKVVHDTYQKLREKKNRLRNLMKLLVIEDDGTVMNKRVKYDSFYIYNSISKKIKNRT